MELNNVAFELSVMIVRHMNIWNEWQCMISNSHYLKKKKKSKDNTNVRIQNLEF